MFPPFIDRKVTKPVSFKSLIKDIIDRRIKPLKTGLLCFGWLRGKPKHQSPKSVYGAIFGKMNLC